MQQFPLVLNGRYDRPIGKISLTEAFVKDMLRDLPENIGNLNISVEYQLEPEPAIRGFSFVTEFRPVKRD